MEMNISNLIPAVKVSVMLFWHEILLSLYTFGFKNATILHYRPEVWTYPLILKNETIYCFMQYKEKEYYKKILEIRETNVAGWF